MTDASARLLENMKHDVSGESPQKEIPSFTENGQKFLLLSKYDESKMLATLYVIPANYFKDPRLNEEDIIRKLSSDPILNSSYFAHVGVYGKFGNYAIHVSLEKDSPFVTNLLSRNPNKELQANSTNWIRENTSTMETRYSAILPDEPTPIVISSGLKHEAQKALTNFATKIWPGKTFLPSDSDEGSLEGHL